LFDPVQEPFTNGEETGLMSDLLAIVGALEADEDLLDEIERRHPDRVTVLLEDGGEDWAVDESGSGRALRDRLAVLLRAIEQRTGAVVVGLAGNREQLRGWRFDRVVGGRSPVPA
jgi:hypothetical protein